jgi:DNA-binding transcriptional regulator YdaS (Cro superfamily)
MVQDYIRSRKALKCAVLARQIGWDRSSFHQWMSGTRRIPAEKLKKLETILINEYGMSKNAIQTDTNPDVMNEIDITDF